MEIFWAIVLFAVGAFVVVKGADFFVSASSWVSDVTGISKVLIGATVVAIATSGPELFVSLIAALEGKVDMSIGNVVGSHLCNLGLGLSLIALFRPTKNKDKLFLVNGLIMIFSAALLLVFCFSGMLSVVHGIIFIAIYGVFTFINIRYSQPINLEDNMLAQSVSTQAASLSDARADGLQDERVVCLTSQDTTAVIGSHTAEAALSDTTQKPKRYKKPTTKKEIIINLLKFVFGLAAIILGSKLIVDKATILAKAMGVSEMFIGLTIVAIGTSLPEIVTTIAAIIKKENDLGIGNIIGSNVFNNTFILAIAAFVTGGLTVNDSVLIDLPVAIVLMLVAIVPTVIGKKLYRWQGITLAAMYIGYIIYLGITS